MPKQKGLGNLFLCIAFYFIIPTGFVLPIAVIFMALTIILAPFIPIAALLLIAYSIMGIIFAIMSYNGYDFSGASTTEP